MFNTDNAPDHDLDILQMSLVVSDAEADNVDFDEALESDRLRTSTTYWFFISGKPPRYAVVDVPNGHKDPVPFIFGDSLLSLNANHLEPPHHLEPHR